MPELVSMAQQFTGLPMGDLIGGPLIAAASANNQMAATQTKFIMDTCFQKEGSDDDATYKPVMIKMLLTQGVINPSSDPGGDPTITTVDTTFDLPLMTIIPMNSLAVDNVDISFDMEVKSSFSDERSEESATSTAAQASLEAKVGWGPFSATVRGSISHDSSSSSSYNSHYQKSNSAQYSVKVHAGQLPLPDGVGVVLDALTKSIQPTIMPTENGGS
ncbi:DUF2589 domain-containing protein [Xanthovirga aplysinae]|uniref:DUF2589 domain-containing protein n=1 Tax=Xanthovirga aplysinae TaxID=2529853 RepID=UPI0012BB566F|nr:DUF2589 domain-containing protein [Xanthovirga aplysinae]MTI31082.1 DUF2589 domain-containing protein [Xanthovirga aplysinae]